MGGKKTKRGIPIPESALKQKKKLPAFHSDTRLMIDRKVGTKRAWVCPAAQFESLKKEVVALYGEEAGYAVINIEGTLGGLWLYAMDELLKGKTTNDQKRIDEAHRLLREYVLERKSTPKGRKPKTKQ